MDFRAKGEDLFEKAQKKLKGWSIFGSSAKYEDASELLEKAANNFKLAKEWQQAADAYKQLAEIHTKLGSRHEAATAYVEASKCLTKIQSPDSVHCLHAAVGIYTDMGRLNQAGRYLREVAEQLEKQEDYNSAIEFYEKAADLFLTEDSNSEANKCRLKVAQYEAKLGRHNKAAEIYEDVASQAAEHNLLKYSAKGYLMNAGICCLCYAEVASIPASIARYREIDLTFSNSRECQLLEDLAKALDDADVQKFTDDVSQFDSLSRLDEWRTSMLLQVKERIKNRLEGADQDSDLQ